MSSKSSKSALSPAVERKLSLEAVRHTQHSCGWLLEIAERDSVHPDAQAAARWLEDVGERAYEFSVSAAVLARKALKATSVDH